MAVDATTHRDTNYSKQCLEGESNTLARCYLDDVTKR